MPRAHSLSFSPTPFNSHYVGDFQSDLRMTYCASVVSSIIGDFSGMDVENTRKMIERCRVSPASVEKLGADCSGRHGKEAMLLDPESSRRKVSRYAPAFADNRLKVCIGGTTYCALASLSLFPPTSRVCRSPFSSPLDETRTAATLRWLLQRQVGGFQGRPGKLEDVCYSFWCGAAIAVSQATWLIDTPC